MSTVSQNIKKQRLRCNLTQEYVAKQLNISVRQMGAFERGEARIHLKLLEDIATVLDTDTFTLLGIPTSKIKEGEDTLSIYFNKFKHLSEEEQQLIFQMIEQLERKRNNDS